MFATGFNSSSLLVVSLDTLCCPWTMTDSKIDQTSATEKVHTVHVYNESSCSGGSECTTVSSDYISYPVTGTGVVSSDCCCAQCIHVNKKIGQTNNYICLNRDTFRSCTGGYHGFLCGDHRRWMKGSSVNMVLLFIVLQGTLMASKEHRCIGDYTIESQNMHRHKLYLPWAYWRTEMVHHTQRLNTKNMQISSYWRMMTCRRFCQSCPIWATQKVGLNKYPHLLIKRSYISTFWFPRKWLH